MSSRSTFSLRPLAAAALAAAAAVLALCAFASAASAAPAVTLIHDWDLNAEPVVEVDGTGFVSPTPVFNPGQGKMGLYAAQIAIVDGEFVIGDAQKWIRTGGPTPEETLNPDGTFSTELEVEDVIGTGAEETDCAEVQCYIATWQAHGNPVLGQLFTQSPIYFAPTVNPAPAQGIAAAGATIAVTGGGFDPDMNPSPNPPNAPRGFYFAQAAVVDVAGTPTVKYGPAQWIRRADYPNSPGSGITEFKLDGTFESELKLSSTFKSGAETFYCGSVQCEIVSWPAQTQPTVANLITRQNISFAFSPLATVTPTTDLPETQQVTISGSGFNPGKPGVYVSQVALVNGSFVTPPPGGGAAMQWIRPENQTLKADGTFETAVTVTKTFKDSNGATVDCAVVQCSVVTWKAHTNPTPASLYTSAPLSFKAPVTPPPAVITPAERPSANKPKQEFQLGTNAAKLNIVSVRCGSSACKFQKPKKVAVKIGDSKLWLPVTGPKQAGVDKVAKFGVRVSKSAAKQLTGKKVRVKFKIQTRSDAGNRTVNINTLLVGASK